MYVAHAKVEDVMTRHVFSVPPDAPFKAIVTELTYRRVSALPVVGADRRPLGVVSEADLLLKEAGVSERHRLERRSTRVERDKALGVTAADVMSSPVVTVAPATSVADAARLMHDRRIKRLVVVDEEGRVAGIVTRGDLLRIFLRSDDDIRAAVRTLAERALWLDIRELQIDVADGVVTFSGNLDRRSNVEALERLARELDGVVGVVNRADYLWDDSKPERIESPQAPYYVPGIRG